MFGRHQCPRETLRSPFQSDPATLLLIHPSQESKDVEDKLGDLVIWLTKLKNSVVTTSTDDDHEEARRREQLTRFLPHPYRLTNSSPLSALDP